MKINEFCTKLTETYNKYFPESKCNAIFYFANVYPSISISCFLVKNASEAINEIIQNDLFSIRFTIDTQSGEFTKGTTNESEISTNLKMESNAKSYTIKPTCNYLAYSSKSLSFRKTIGNPEKIIKSFDSFCQKLRESVIESYQTGLIHPNHKSIIESKIINVRSSV